MHALPRRRRSARAVTLLALLLALTVAAPAAVPSASAAVDTGAETDLSALVDGERAAAGAPSLRVCGDLRDLARRWSARMADDGRLSHNPDLGAQTRGWRSLGENVGFDASADAVHQRFMVSAPHRAHILSRTYTEVGIGVEHRSGRLWVTEIFRESDGTAPCSVVALDERITNACPPHRTPAAPFPDIRGNTHREAIDCITWYGLTNGTRDETFAPADTLTRSRMAAFLARLVERAGVRLPSARDQGFTDVAGSAHADPINQLASLGIVEGLTATTYGPKEPVTRAQMATFLVRAYERVSGERLTTGRDWFPDDGGIAHEDAINRAAEAGFVTGLTSSAYGPQRTVRRDQLASFLARALDRLVARGHLSPPR